MTMLTSLEKRALTEIFSRMGLATSIGQDVIRGLKIERREFSEDVADSARCIGEFIYFAPGESLPILSPPTHQGASATRADLPGGADFLLFLKDGAPTFLEIGFFGFPLPKTVLREGFEAFVF
jgi:hypothetical protein